MPEVKKLVEVAFPVDSPPKSGTKRPARLCLEIIIKAVPQPNIRLELL